MRPTWTGVVIDVLADRQQLVEPGVL